MRRDILSFGAILDDWQNLDTAARDRAYDNMAAVADSAEQVKTRLARSASFRRSATGRLDLPYGEGARKRLDFYQGDPNAPWVFFIHGGYWLKNDGPGFAWLVEGLVEHGWNAVVPTYPLAPDARLTDIVAATRAALDWLSAFRREADDGPVLLAGWSAGATLAMLHASHPVVDHVMAISGLYELSPLADTSMNASLKLSEGEIERYSPLRLPPPKAPISIVVGGDELPALQGSSIAMANHLQTAPLVLSGHDHFSILAELAEKDGQLARLAVRQLSEPLS